MHPHDYDAVSSDQPPPSFAASPRVVYPQPTRHRGHKIALGIVGLIVLAAGIGFVAVLMKSAADEVNLDAANGIAKTCPAQDLWLPYSSEQGCYQALFPHKPKEIQEQVQTGIGERTAYSVQCEAGGVLFGITHISAEATHAKYTVELQSGLHQLALAMNGQVEREEWVKGHRYFLIRGTIRGGNQLVSRVALIWCRHRVYTLIAEALTVGSNESEFQYFLDNFRFTAGAFSMWLFPWIAGGEKLASYGVQHYQSQPLEIAVRYGFDFGPDDEKWRQDALRYVLIATPPLPPEIVAKKFYSPQEGGFRLAVSGLAPGTREFALRAKRGSAEECETFLLTIETLPDPTDMGELSVTLGKGEPTPLAADRLTVDVIAGQPFVLDFSASPAHGTPELWIHEWEYEIGDLPIRGVQRNRQSKRISGSTIQTGLVKIPVTCVATVENTDIRFTRLFILELNSLPLPRDRIPNPAGELRLERQIGRLAVGAEVTMRVRAVPFAPAADVSWEWNPNEWPKGFALSPAVLSKYDSEYGNRLDLSAEGVPRVAGTYVVNVLCKLSLVGVEEVFEVAGQFTLNVAEMDLSNLRVPKVQDFDINASLYSTRVGGRFSGEVSGRYPDGWMSNVVDTPPYRKMSVSWTYDESQLPPGITVTPGWDRSTSGWDSLVFEGRPTAAGRYEFEVVLTVRLEFIDQVFELKRQCLILVAD